MTREIARLSEIDREFDAVLLDQYGVLHDGRSAFPGTIDCVRGLAARGVPIVALSNSGKRASYNAARLERLGFPQAWFRAVVTSGELANARLAAMLADGRIAPGAGVAILMRGEDGSAIESHDLRRVSLEDDPALLVIAGSEPERRTREDSRAAIAPLAARRVPALCINPDLQIYTGAGPDFGPGAIAKDYRALGGEVVMLGKPGPEMFTAGLAALGNPDPSRVLMIGDSPAHDIAGAQQADCLTLLIRGGVQGEAVGAVPDFAMDALAG